MATVTNRMVLEDGVSPVLTNIVNSLDDTARAFKALEDTASRAFGVQSTGLENSLSGVQQSATQASTSIGTLETSVGNVATAFVTLENTASRAFGVQSTGLENSLGGVQQSVARTSTSIGTLEASVRDVANAFETHSNSMADNLYDVTMAVYAVDNNLDRMAQSARNGFSRVETAVDGVEFGIYQLRNVTAGLRSDMATSTQAMNRGFEGVKQETVEVKNEITRLGQTMKQLDNRPLLQGMLGNLKNIAKETQNTNRRLDSLSKAVSRIDRGGSIRNISTGFRNTNTHIRSSYSSVTKLTRGVRNLGGSGRDVFNIFNRWNNPLLKAASAIYVLQRGFHTLSQSARLFDEQIQSKARIGLIANELETVKYLQDEIYKSSQRTYSSYSDTAGAVAKMGLLAQDAFSSSTEIVQFVELLNKSFRISGSSTEEQSAAIYQLTQAMASGVLQGDEFRSLMETAPMLMDSLSKYIGVTKGELKKLGSEGKLTADTVRNALFFAADDINEKYKEIPATVGGVFQRIANDATVAFRPLVQEVQDFINSPVMEGIQTFLRKVFVWTNDAIIRLIRYIETIPGKVQAAWAVIEPYHRKFENWVARMEIKVNRFIANFKMYYGGAWSEFVSNVRNGLSELRSRFEGFGGAIWVAINTIVRYGIIIKNVLGMAIGGIVGVLGDVFGRIGSLFQDMRGHLTDFVQSPQFQQLKEGIQDIIVYLVNKANVIRTRFMQAAKIIGYLAAPVLGFLIGEIGRAISAIMTIAGTVADIFVEIFTPIWAWMLQQLPKVINILGIVISWVVDRLEDISGWFSRNKETITSAVIAIGSAVALYVGINAVRDFGKLFTAGSELATKLGGIKTAITTAFANPALLVFVAIVGAIIFIMQHFDISLQDLWQRLQDMGAMIARVWEENKVTIVTALSIILTLLAVYYQTSLVQAAVATAQFVMGAISNFGALLTSIWQVVAGMLAQAGATLAAALPWLVLAGVVIAVIGLWQTGETWAKVLAGAIVLVTIAVLALNAGLLANPIILIVVLVIALIAILIDLWRTNIDFRYAVKSIWEYIKYYMTVAWQEAIYAIVKGLMWLDDKMNQISIWIAFAFNVAWAAIKDSAMMTAKSVYDFFKDALDGVLPLVNKVLAAFGEKQIQGINVEFMENYTTGKYINEAIEKRDKELNKNDFVQSRNRILLDQERQKNIYERDGNLNAALRNLEAEKALEQAELDRQKAELEQQEADLARNDKWADRAKEGTYDPNLAFEDQFYEGEHGGLDKKDILAARAKQNDVNAALDGYGDGSGILSGMDMKELDALMAEWGVGETPEDISWEDIVAGLGNVGDTLKGFDVGDPGAMPVQDWLDKMNAPNFDPSKAGFEGIHGTSITRKDLVAQHAEYGTGAPWLDFGESLEGWEDFGADFGDMPELPEMTPFEELLLPDEDGGKANKDKDKKLKGGKLDKIGKIEDDVKLSSEAIKLMTDIARQRYINRYSTTSPVTNVTFGDVRETADINQLTKAVEKAVERAYAKVLVD